MVGWWVVELGEGGGAWEGEIGMGGGVGGKESGKQCRRFGRGRGLVEQARGR